MTSSLEKTGLEHAIALHRGGDSAAAIRRLREIVAGSPQDGGAWHALGLITLAAVGAAEAIDPLRHAAQVMPFEAAVYEDLASAYIATAHAELALDCRQAAAALTRDAAEIRARYEQARLHQSFNEITPVIDALWIVVSAVPAFAGANKALGDYLRQAWKVGVMRAKFGELVDLDRPVREDRALLDQAERYYRSALRHDPDDAETYSALGNLLLDLGRTAEAVGTHRSAAERAPADAIVQFNLARALEHDDDASALAGFRRAASIQPHFREAHERLAGCLVRLGRHLEAAVHFDLALDGEPTMSMRAYF